MKKYLLLFIALFITLCNPVSAQKLKISSPDGSRGIPAIKYGRKNGHATIVIESAVNGLNVSTTTYDPVYRHPSRTGTQYSIDVNVDSLRQCGNPYLYRELILTSPNSSKMQLSVPSAGNEELSDALYYYTVTLPDKFPVTLSVEWLMNDHSQKGFRIGYGGRYGFIVGYTWGNYRPSGDNIDNVSSDCDLSYAKLRGYIRTTIFGGFRMGLLSNKVCPLYMYLGLGYGEYGRQWENKIRLENSKYFYSDYIKGVNANLGLSAKIMDVISVSAGADMIMSKGKFTMEWQAGIGICLDMKNWFKHKTKL